MKKNLRLLTVLALAPALFPPSTGRAFTWSASGLDGAGTQNCLAIQPGGTGVILSASDVSGIQRSTDDGVTWNGSNIGTPSGGPGKIAVIVWTDNASHASTAYAGDSDGFLTSTDGGSTWAQIAVSPIPTFDGNGTTIRWPRSTGNLVACDQASAWPGNLYCGCINPTTDGGAVMRSTDGGINWTSVFTSSDYIRGLALDPANTSILYAATYGDYVYKTTSAKTVSGNSGWSQLTAGPNQPEELLVLTDGTVYAAGSNLSGTDGTGGIWKSTDAGTAWTSLSVPSTTSSESGDYNSYLGIAGYGSASTAVLYACATGPASDGNDDASVIKSTDGGSTWANITQTANVVDQIGGSGGPSWWQMQSNAGYYYELGAGQGDMANIQVDPSNHSRVMTSGRAGIWGTTNATAADGSIAWYPMVAGLSVCVANWACTDPNKPGRIYVSDEDWTFFYSTDSGATFARNAGGMTDGTTGRPIFVDPANSTVYCGELEESATEGDLYSNPDPTTGQSWTSTGFKAAVGGDGAQVRGAVVGRDGSGNTVIIACAGDAEGVWYKDGSNAWTQATASIVPSGADVVQFAWNQGSQYVFVYAQGSGLWRSDNYGLNSGGSSSWTNVWSTDSSGTGTGFVAEDPTTDGTIYVSTGSGVFRFTGADTGALSSPTNMGGPANPGAMTLANGILYCCNLDSSGGNGSMYQWLAPSVSTDSSVISDSVVYPGQSEWPSGMAADSNGTVYLSERDEGCMVGSSLLYADDFTDGSGNWTTDGGTWSVVSVSGGDAYQQSSTSGTSISYINISGSSNWQSYSMSADVTPLTFTSGSVGLSLYFEDSNDRYMLQITPTNTVNIKSDSGGTQTTLASGSYSYASGDTYTLELVANSTAGTLTAFVNGTQVAQATGITFTPSLGTAAVNTYTSSADFSNVLVNQL